MFQIYAQEAEQYGISLKKYVEGVNITVADISDKALTLARTNAENILKIHDINFIQSDMFQNINGKFDVIISNPPYIKKDIIKDYSLEYEPKLALDRRRRRTKVLQNNNRKSI